MMMLTIELSLEDARIIASMIPKAALLREEAMRAALAFLEQIDGGEDNGDPFVGKDVTMR
jgi:hypothetical protein